MRSSAVLFLLCCPAVVLGHGYLLSPKPRNLVHSTYQYTYPGGDGSGDRDDSAIANRITAGGFDFFPDLYPAEGTHGLCGDPWRSAGITEMPAIEDQEMMKPGPYQVIWQEGDVIEVQVAITANHRGFVEFRICDHSLNTTLGSQAEGQLCLDQHLLLRLDPFDPLRNGECGTPDAPVSPGENVDCAPVDPDWPARMYVPPDHLLDRVEESGLTGTYFTMKLKLPEGLLCENAACTMQWWWMTSNRCIPLGEIDWYASFHQQYPEMVNVWNPTGTTRGRECSLEKQGQQFWNCADIVILSEGGTAPAQIASVEDGDDGEGGGGSSCLNTWADCSGGQCCSGGDICYKKDASYEQCMPEGECEARFGNDPQWECSITWPPQNDDGWADWEEVYTTASGDSAPDSTPAPSPSSPESSEAPATPQTTPAPPPPPSTSPPPPPPPPPPSSTPAAEEPGELPDDCDSSEYIPLYGTGTGQHSGCCADGLLCYRYNDAYSQCRAPGTCPDCVFNCSVVPQGCGATRIPKHGNCRTSHCCAAGLVCYEQDGGYAQCMEEGECPACDSWTCNVLVHGLTDYPFTSNRRSRPAPPATASAEVQESVEDDSELLRRRSGPSELQDEEHVTAGDAPVLPAQGDGARVGLAASVLMLSAGLVLSRARRGQSIPLTRTALD